MRMSSIEEYGLRCLLQLARHRGAEPLSIPQMAEAEGLSPEYTAKLLRVLREADLVTSTRGAAGGYRLSRPAAEITVLQAITALDGPLFSDAWCDNHAGKLTTCIHTTDCAVRSLWRWMGTALESVMKRVTLADMIGGELRATDVLEIASLEGER